MTPENLIRDEIRGLSAYHVPNPGDAIKLDAMENPFAWPASLPQSLLQQWSQGLAEVAVNRYPSPDGNATPLLTMHNIRGSWCIGGSTAGFVTG